MRSAKVEGGYANMGGYESSAPPGPTPSKGIYSPATTADQQERARNAPASQPRMNLHTPEVSKPYTPVARLPEPTPDEVPMDEGADWVYCSPKKRLSTGDQIQVNRLNKGLTLTLTLTLALFGYR